MVRNDGGLHLRAKRWNKFARAESFAIISDRSERCASQVLDSTYVLDETRKRNKKYGW